MQMPHLLDIQTRAFESLLQLDAASHDREDIGLERVFKDLFPITDVHENFSLEFVQLFAWRAEVLRRGVHRARHDVLRAAQGHAAARDQRGGQRRSSGRATSSRKRSTSVSCRCSRRSAPSSSTAPSASIVSQLHRSPGVVFEESTHPNGQRLISARIIPFRGSWVEFTVDIHDVIYVHIDKKKKFPATALLRAFGYGSDSDILPPLLRRARAGPHQGARRTARSSAS